MTAAPISAPRERLAWLDLYRGLAVLVMIEAHVTNTFLAVAHRAEGWFASLNYVNGWVAPAFLFIAGYAHGLRKGRTRMSLARRLGRLAGIAAIGYALHFPWTEIAAGQWGAAVRAGTRMDILPCLAVALAVLALAERFSGRGPVPVVAGLLFGVVFLAPRLASFTAAPAPLLALLNQTTGSLFPLLPWVAFAFAGYLAGWIPMRWMAAPILGAAVAVFLLGRADLSAASPAFFFERLAWILVLVPVCGWVAPRFAPAAVLFAGRESLVMYVAHLLLIPNLVRTGLASLSVAATAALLVAALAATFAATWGWRWISVWRADRARRAMHPRES